MRDEEWKLASEKIASLAGDFAALKIRVDAIGEQVVVHEAILADIKSTREMTKEILGYLTSIKGFFAVWGWFAWLAKKLWPLWVTLIAVVVYIKTGEWKLKF